LLDKEEEKRRRYQVHFLEHLSTGCVEHDSVIFMRTVVQLNYWLYRNGGMVVVHPLCVLLDWDEDT
jgi:hypothetical protein